MQARSKRRPVRYPLSIGERLTLRFGVPFGNLSQPVFVEFVKKPAGALSVSQVRIAQQASVTAQTSSRMLAVQTWQQGQGMRPAK